MGTPLLNSSSSRIIRTIPSVVLLMWQDLAQLQSALRYLKTVPVSQGFQESDDSILFLVGETEVTQFLIVDVFGNFR
jgi:hypothetical protein